MQSSFQHEKVIRDTPAIAWFILALTSAAWLAAYFRPEVYFRYFLATNLKSFLVGLLFPGFGPWAFLLNFIGSHMATWYISKQASLTNCALALALTYFWLTKIDTIDFHMITLVSQLSCVAYNLKNPRKSQVPTLVQNLVAAWAFGAFFMFPKQFAVGLVLACAHTLLLTQASNL